jgi:hypothetical protein
MPLNMLEFITALSLATAAIAAGGQQAQPPAPAVKVGDRAPDFTLSYLVPGDEPGRFAEKQVKLSDFKGRLNVVVAFFPAAFSPG